MSLDIPLIENSPAATVWPGLTLGRVPFFFYFKKILTILVVFALYFCATPWGKSLAGVDFRVFMNFHADELFPALALSHGRNAVLSQCRGWPGCVQSCVVQQPRVLGCCLDSPCRCMAGSHVLAPMVVVMLLGTSLRQRVILEEAVKKREALWK